MGEIEAFWSNEERLTLHKTVGKFHFSTMVKTLNMRQTGTQEDRLWHIAGWQKDTQEGRRADRHISRDKRRPGFSTLLEDRQADR